MQSRLEGAANVCFHSVSDHDHLLQLAKREFLEFAPGALKHVAVGFAEIISPPARARLEKGRRCSSARSSLHARNRAPIVRVGRQEARTTLEAFMRFGHFLECRRALA